MSQTLSSPTPVLLVEDDADVQQAARLLLPRHGFVLHAARTPEACWSLLAAHPIRLVLLDLNFSSGATSGAEGLALLEALLAHDPGLSVVVVTAHSGIRIAVEAMRAGAADFVMKPWNNERLVATLRTASLPTRRGRAPVDGRLPPPPEDGPLLGDSPALAAARALLVRLGSSDAPVLLSGPAGTGKSLSARLLHRLSSRAARPLQVLDPAALWDEGEPALRSALERLQEHDTVLLDGLEALASLPSAQHRLMARLDAMAGLRVLSCSRQDAAALRAAGLRAELLSRLSLVEIALPPLRARGDDGVMLAGHFLGLFTAGGPHAGLVLSDAAQDAIRQAEWPDNVRGLRQAVERAVLLALPGRPALDPPDLLPPGSPIPGSPIPGGPIPGNLAAPPPTLRDTERELVEAALRRNGFNISRAAQELGLTRTALYRRMARHGL